MIVHRDQYEMSFILFPHGAPVLPTSAAKNAYFIEDCLAVMRGLEAWPKTLFPLWSF